jgi:hypothetical protein
VLVAWVAWEAWVVFARGLNPTLAMDSFRSLNPGRQWTRRVVALGLNPALAMDSFRSLNAEWQWTQSSSRVAWEAWVVLSRGSTQAQRALAETRPKLYCKVRGVLAGRLDGCWRGSRPL